MQRFSVGSFPFIEDCVSSMMKRYRESNLVLWSIRLLGAMNILIILGSIGFLTFEIQFEPHPAEFGWSLIMIAILTMLSGIIGCISSRQTGCFFPHMFFTFVSFMGLFSLSVLLFVRPDEVARKMLTFHIFLPSAMHHLYIDAYVFSLLGFLQFLTFTLTYIVHKHAYAEQYQDLDIHFQQHQLTPADDSAHNKISMPISAAVIISEGCKQETHQTQSSSPCHWKKDAQSPTDHRNRGASSTSLVEQESEILSTEERAAALPTVVEFSTKMEQKEAWSFLQDCYISSSSKKNAKRCCVPGELLNKKDVLQSKTNVRDHHRHAGFPLDTHNPTVTFIYSSSSSSCWSADDRRACFISTSAHLHSSSSSSSSLLCEYSISKEFDPRLQPFCDLKEQQKQVSANASINFRLHLIALMFGTVMNLAFAHFKRTAILQTGLSNDDLETGDGGMSCIHHHHQLPAPPAAAAAAR